MKQKTKISIVLVIIMLTLYYIFVVVQADNVTGSQLAVKGGEIENVEAGGWVTYQDQIEALNLSWARIHVRWNMLDKTGSGDFTFSENPLYVTFKDSVVIAKNTGAEVVVTIKGAPQSMIEPTPLATAPNGNPTPWPFPCGRVSTDPGIVRLKQFTVALLEQLRMDFGYGPNDPPPVKYIELWNEPDASAVGHPFPNFFGCWVNGYEPTPYYNGGVYYAAVLNEVAPYVKSQFPAGSVKFVAGAAAEKDNGFLQAVIENAIDNIDVVSYHQYVPGSNYNCDPEVSIAVRGHVL